MDGAVIGKRCFLPINSGRLIVFLLLTAVSIYFAGIFLNKINDGFALAKKGLEKEDRKKLKANILWQKKAVVTAAVLFIFGICLCLNIRAFLFWLRNFLQGFSDLNPILKHLSFAAARYIVLHPAGGWIYYRCLQGQIPRNR